MRAVATSSPEAEQGQTERIDEHGIGDDDAGDRTAIRGEPGAERRSSGAASAGAGIGRHAAITTRACNGVRQASRRASTRVQERETRRFVEQGRIKGVASSRRASKSIRESSRRASKAIREQSEQRRNAASSSRPLRLGASIRRVHDNGQTRRQRSFQVLTAPSKPAARPPAACRSKFEIRDFLPCAPPWPTCACKRCHCTPDALTAPAGRDSWASARCRGGRRSASHPLCLTR